MKYEITSESILFEGIVLYQIKALSNIPVRSVIAGDLGGYIEKASNLAQDGECWVYPNARILEDAMALESSAVRDTSVLRGTAVIKGNSLLTGNSMMNQDELDDSMILVNEQVTQPIEKEKPRGGVDWGTWMSDTNLHCGCESHEFSFWDRAKDSTIKVMHGKAFGWWVSNKARLMGKLNSKRGLNQSGGK